MSAILDETHDASLDSWVGSAGNHPDFPLQNLPLGIISTPGAAPRGGVAIGDAILDLAGLAGAGALTSDALEAARLASGPSLNPFLAAGAPARRALRLALSRLLRRGSGDEALVRPHLRAAKDCTLHLPAVIGDYTDFYAGIHHATNVGRQFRPDNPLLPNYKHVPIGYHGRSSSIIPSGAAFRRPRGQRLAPGAALPSFDPTRRLDYELELGIWIGGDNAQGTPVGIGEAADAIAGYGLLNDWSAREIQAWEYQPLGPFLAKNFATTVSPWIVSPEALAPFRTAQAPRPDGDPSPLPYLLDSDDQVAGALAVELGVEIRTAAMREHGLAWHRLATSDARHLYWTPAQLVAHHSCNGCNLRAGDLFGSGTVSGPDPDGVGSLLELTQGGKAPVLLPNGETRTFLEDGDEIALVARASRDGYAGIGFGPCIGRVLPAIG